ERAMLRDGQILYAYLHLAPDPEQTEDLLKAGVYAIAYETVTDKDGGLPLLAPMSEVAGRLAVQAAGMALTAQAGGRGVLLGGVPGVPPARVVIIGGGVVGINAARMAMGVGADVTVLDTSIPRLREIDSAFDGRIRTLYSTRGTLKDATASADAVIGAVLVAGARAPKLVDRAMLAHMKPGAVLVDVAIDQGGCFETSRPTTHEDPTYIVDGIVHYCVANMPGAVPLTASTALNHATLAQGLKIADIGVVEALRTDPHLRDGLNAARGHVVHPVVAENLGLPLVPVEDILSA
ncbi:MAG: alanine dehydrogenase, partial [Alphaproteobacteria bacterium]|nr:alanine dehydrogenase [Alphaproteobacteria bacterium]